MENKINVSFIRVAAILGAVAVALGAFAAHGLKEEVSEEAYNIFEVGVRYQFYHVFALALTGIVFYYGDPRKLKVAGNLFMIGMLLFSGSLYALTFAVNADSTGLLKLGVITPFGGVCFIVGWLMLFIGFKPKKS